MPICSCGTKTRSSPRKREQQVVADDARDLLRLEADQLRDAVVLVHDVVARAQVGEARERAADRRGRARRLAAEDLRVGQERDAEVAPDEAAARGRDREDEALRLDARREHLGLDAAQQVPLALGLAAVRERDDDVEPAAEQAVELVLRLGQPARGQRRPLRVERERLALRERVELGRALERQLVEALLGPDRAHLVGLPHEVGRAVERQHEVVRSGRPAGERILVVGERDLDELAAPLAGGVDRGAVDLAQRALRERREGADALDLVAEELDPQRLAAGGREDVDEAAAHRELPALLDPLDALVAGARELPRPAGRSRARRRARSRAARGAPSGGGIRSASASADEQTSPPRASTSSARARSPTRCGGGSRPEPQRTPRDGKSATLLLAEEPRGRLGQVARVGVVGQQHAERPRQLLVQRRDEQRQRRLGHARTRRKRRGEGGQLLVGAKPVDEGVEQRTVHDVCPEQPLRGRSW